MAKFFKHCSNGFCKTAYVVFKSVELFFILPFAFLSKRVFDKAWEIYYMKPLEKNIFNLCVQFLLYVGAKVNLSYEKINVLILCLVWPIITICSILLNVILLIK